MKILFINRMMGVAWGGGENYDYHLARGLQRRGHEVLMLTGRAAGQAGPAPPAGLESISIESPYLRKHMYNLAGRVPLLPGLFAEADLRLFMEGAKRTILDTLARRDIDVVQILALPYLASWLGAHRPAAMRFPGPPAWFQSGLLRRLGRNERFKMFTHGDAVGYFQNHLQTPVREIPPGINRDLFHRTIPGARASARHELGLDEGDFVLVTVGRLIAGKGHEFLLRALAGIEKPIKLLVVGGGPLQSQFEAQANQAGLGGRVLFAGQCDATGVAQALRAADAFCLLSAYENYSNAALEAMATGLPVVASDLGGFRQQVTDGENGHLIAYNDDETLRMRLRQLLANPDRLRLMADAAERFAARFSWESAAAQVEEIYAELTA